jgi:hypothetical protein
VGHPILLVRIVAGEVIDLSHAIDIDDVLHQADGENGANR